MALGSGSEHLKGLDLLRLQLAAGVSSLLLLAVSAMCWAPFQPHPSPASSPPPPAELTGG